MSMSTAQYRGFGFYTHNISEENTKAFCKKYLSVLEKIPNEETVDACEFDVENYYEGLAEAVAKVINTQTKLDVSEFSHQDEYGREAVMLLAQLPWVYNEHERTLTRDELLNELEPYASILGIKRDEIDVVEIEYYG